MCIHVRLFVRYLDFVYNGKFVILESHLIGG